MATILLVEDNDLLAATLCDFFQAEGFIMTRESNGILAEQRILVEKPDLVILDLMLPDKDGIRICQSIRNRYVGMILMFTAKEEEVDQIVGLEVGADDYMVKPVKPRLLLAKVRSLLRRNHPAATLSVKQFNQLTIREEERVVLLNEQVIDLTDMEFTLLNLLTNFPGETLSRNFISLEVNGREYDGLDRSIDNIISQLRRKLRDDVDKPKRIKTIRGKGYVFIPSLW